MDQIREEQFVLRGGPHDGEEGESKYLGATIRDWHNPEIKYRYTGEEDANGRMIFDFREGT